MSARPFRPLRWVAGGSGALIVTIWAALMLGLHAPMVRSVPVAPWADAGYGADRHPGETAEAARLAPGGASPLRPAHVAGVRFSVPLVDSSDDDPRRPFTPGAPRPTAPDAPLSPSVPAVTAPEPPAPGAPDPSKAPAVPSVPALPAVPPPGGGIGG